MRLSGVSVNQFMRSNVACYHRSGSHKATPTESYSADNRCIRSDGDAFFDPGLYWYPVAGPAARSEVISKNCVWSKEDIVVNVHVLPKTNSILDRNVIAYRHSILDESVISNITVSANDDIFLHMSERPYASAFTDFLGFDQCLLVNKWFRVAHAINASLLDALPHRF